MNPERAKCDKCGHPQPQRRRFAFTGLLANSADLTKEGLPEMPPGSYWIIGRADEGTRGYSPIIDEGLFEDERGARMRAEWMNTSIGLKPDEAAMIVLSTMQVRESEMERILARGIELVKNVVEDQCGCLAIDDFEEWIKEAKPHVKEE